MPDHRFALSSEVHEPKHITNSTTSDSGKVITPSSSVSNKSELRYLSLGDLSDGGNVLSLQDLVDNDAINYQGWENVEDGLITTPSIVVDTTYTQLTIDDEDQVNGTEAGHLPKSIRGLGNLWDTASSKITPIAEGDTYLVRIRLDIDASSGTPDTLTAVLDMGTLVSPTNIILEDTKNISKAAPYRLTFDFPIFCMATFKANGARIFLKTKAGTVTVGARSIFINRLGSGDNKLL